MHLCKTKENEMYSPPLKQLNNEATPSNLNRNINPSLHASSGHVVMTTRLSCQIKYDYQRYSMSWIIFKVKMCNISDSYRLNTAALAVYTPAHTALPWSCPALWPITTEMIRK